MRQEQGQILTTWDFCRFGFDSIHLPGGVVQKHHSWYLLASNTCLSLTEKSNHMAHPRLPMQRETENGFPSPCDVMYDPEQGRKKTERVELFYDHPSLIVL